MDEPPAVREGLVDSADTPPSSLHVDSTDCATTAALHVTSHAAFLCLVRRMMAPAGATTWSWMRVQLVLAVLLSMALFKRLFAVFAACSVLVCKF